MRPDIYNLIKKHPLISDQVDSKELAVILRELLRCLERGTTGDVVEFGCYAGTTSLFLRRVLDDFGSEKALHVYDSFEGLPQKSPQDQSPSGAQFRAGELSTSKKELLKNFQKARLKPPTIHKAWFSELQPNDVPEEICFAFLDGDFYESILDSLQLISPRLSQNATVIVDDYASEALPGAKKAVDEWLNMRGATLRTEASLAVILV